MVLVKEYRIPMPISVEEYRIAQLYMVSKVSKEHSGHGEGVQVIENRPYTDEGLGNSGQYTHKHLRIGSRLPGWIKSIAPASALIIEEKAWNAYPYCKTVYSCPFLGERFSITIETRYEGDSGTQENAFHLPADQRAACPVDVVDIAYDPLDPSKYKEEEDPTLFVSQKTGRGKLKEDWIQTEKPIMCCYKLCTAEFRYWGLQTRAEAFIHKAALRDIFQMGHRQVFCWLDEWFGLTMEDVRKIEQETQKELDEMAQEPDGAGPSH
eukprot:TRINITY_DN1542_c0_g1_i1.p1 TRINITY_DN1542_c0_g1~~TRINITY_DN1542_c0_g1_i1.p1  ORF type:complete len:266 (-),score=75.27 TRINITY_DN1542_c0_g1_i1:80-877(-)